jgi:hypothetical protein
VTGFEPQCVFKPKLGAAGKYHLITANNETMVLFWHGVYAETMGLL